MQPLPYGLADWSISSATPAPTPESTSINIGTDRIPPTRRSHKVSSSDPKLLESVLASTDELLGNSRGQKFSEVLSQPLIKKQANSSDTGSHQQTKSESVSPDVVVYLRLDDKISKAIGDDFSLCALSSVLPLQRLFSFLPERPEVGLSSDIQNYIILGNPCLAYRSNNLISNPENLPVSSPEISLPRSDVIVDWLHDMWPVVIKHCRHNSSSGVCESIITEDNAFEKTLSRVVPSADFNSLRYPLTEKIKNESQTTGMNKQDSEHRINCKHLLSHNLESSHTTDFVINCDFMSSTTAQFQSQFGKRYRSLAAATNSSVDRGSNGSLFKLGVVSHPSMVSQQSSEHPQDFAGGERMQWVLVCRDQLDGNNITPHDRSTGHDNVEKVINIQYL